MFLGVNKLNLDSKGRLAVPVKYREQLSVSAMSNIIVTINPLEPCLWMYPESEWEKIASKLSDLGTMNKRNRTMQRLILGHASELDMDGQGRILLSAELREYAVMEKRVALVGEGKKFELWNEQHWMDGRAGWLIEASDSASDLSDQLGNLAL